MAEKMTNRQISALETKDAIYNAAMELFQSKGYENVLVEDITKAANTAKGTFYIYFKSKKELLFHTFAKFDELYVDVYKQVTSIPTFEERFLTYIEVVYDGIDKRGKKLPKALYSNSVLESNPFLLQNDRVLFQNILELMKFGIETGELSTNRTAEYYRDMFKIQITGINYIWCSSTEAIDIAKHAKESMRAFLHGLKNL